MKYRPVEDEVRRYQEHLERRAGESYPYYPKRRSSASWVQFSADLVWMITLVCIGIMRVNLMLHGASVSAVADATVIAAISLGLLASQAHSYKVSTGLRVLSTVSIIVSMAVLMQSST